MRNNVKIAKRLVSILLVFLFSIKSFAAVVSDNDGSAFITKSEFDALKSAFQTQIDNYNKSIDSKIDGAIAAYLAGIQIATETTEKFVVGAGEKLCFGDTSKIENLGTWNAAVKMMIIYIGSNTANTKTGSEFQVCYDVDIKDNTTMGSKCLEISADKFKGFIMDYKPTYTNNWTVLRKVANQTAAAVPANQGIRYPTAYEGWTTANGYEGYWNAHPEQFWDDTPITSTTTMETVWKQANINNVIDTLYGGTSINNGCNMGFYTSTDPGYKFNYSASEVNHSYSLKKSMKASYADKILWFLDDNINTTHLYSDLSLDNANWVYYNVHNPWIDKYDKIENFNSKVIIYGLGKNNPGSIDNNCWFNGVTGKCWYTKNYSGSDASTGGKYSLPRPKEVTKKPSELVNNNFDFSIISSFVSDGFHGYLTEGMPLYNSKSNDRLTIDFDLDTTGLANNVYFAISGKPFESDKKINNRHEMTGLALTIDGISATDGYASLDNTKVHKISVTSTKQGCIYYKLGFDPASTTIKTYGTIVIPSEMTITKL